MNKVSQLLENLTEIHGKKGRLRIRCVQGEDKSKKLALNESRAMKGYVILKAKPEASRPE